MLCRGHQHWKSLSSKNTCQLSKRYMDRIANRRRFVSRLHVVSAICLHQKAAAIRMRNLHAKIKKILIKIICALLMHAAWVNNKHNQTISFGKQQPKPSWLHNNTTRSSRHTCCTGDCKQTQSPAGLQQVKGGHATHRCHKH